MALQSSQIVRIFTADPAINWVRYYVFFSEKLQISIAQKVAGFKREDISINDCGQKKYQKLQRQFLTARERDNSSDQWCEYEGIQGGKAPGLHPGQLI